MVLHQPFYNILGVYKNERFCGGEGKHKNCKIIRSML